MTVPGVRSVAAHNTHSAHPSLMVADDIQRSGHEQPSGAWRDELVILPSCPYYLYTLNPVFAPKARNQSSM
eukprot:5117679-Amphidinium_carterae.1